MELSLREAAERTSRSVTTLRRYIRSGRLRASKKPGRYGPEYFVNLDDLVQAGLEVDLDDAGTSPRLQETRLALHEAGPRAVVPRDLYQELQMKHEQLLVQYGMIRASGLRFLEIRDEMERLKAENERLQAQVREKDREAAEWRRRMSRRLREAQLEIEARRLEAAALREKVRALEMLTRNAVTTETLDAQFSALARQIRKVEGLKSGGTGPASGDGKDH